METKTEAEMEADFIKIAGEMNDSPWREKFGTWEGWDHTAIMYLLRELYTCHFIGSDAVNGNGFSVVGLGMAIMENEHGRNIQLSTSLYFLWQAIKFYLDDKEVMTEVDPRVLKLLKMIEEIIEPELKALEDNIPWLTLAN